jgi:glycosyltransferase involved in cell wall biosynthesis
MQIKESNNSTSDRTISFTIVTPVFNRADCIERCIKSVINQNYNEIEHWIVDDGSTDNTYNIIQKYAAQNPLIKYHRFDKNKGVNAARNYATQNSAKDFVIFLDSDDYFVNGALETISNVILAHPEYRHFLFAQDDRMPYYDQNPVLKEKQTKLSFADFLTAKISGDFVHVMETGLVQTFPFDEKLRIYEDLTFLSIFKAGEKQLYVKEIAVNRERNRSDSVTKTTYLQSKDAFEKQYISLKDNLSLFEKDYLQLKAQDKLSALIKRTFFLGVALDKYQDNKSIRLKAKELNIKLPVLFRITDKFQLGFILRNAIFVYSYIKNNIIKNK